MSDPTPPAAPAAPAPAQQPPAAPASPPAQGEEYKAMTPEQFKARLDGATSAGVKQALKELGFEKAEDAKARLDALKKLEDAQKTEAQKTAERIAALEPEAAKAKAYGETIAAYAESEFKALPAEAQALVTAQAGDDPHARLKTIAALRTSGVLAKLGAAPAPAQPASTKAGPTAPPPAGQQQKHPSQMTPEERKAAEAAFLAQFR